MRTRGAITLNGWRRSVPSAQVSAALLAERLDHLELRVRAEPADLRGHACPVAGKVYWAFTASNTAHGGQEATLLALGNVFYHWGGIIVPPGYPGSGRHLGMITVPVVRGRR
jgi:hypothetical protein